MANFAGTCTSDNKGLLLLLLKTPFLISTRNEWSVLMQDIPYYMHTSYETILLQHF